MERFVHKSRIDARAEDVYAWHTRPGTLGRLLHSWEDVKLREWGGNLVDRRVVLTMPLRPFRSRWVARHVDVPSLSPWRTKAGKR